MNSDLNALTICYKTNLKASSYHLHVKRFEALNYRLRKWFVMLIADYVCRLNYQSLTHAALGLLLLIGPTCSQWEVLIVNSPVVGMVLFTYSFVILITFLRCLSITGGY